MEARTPVRIVVERVGELKGELVRIYAPITVETLARKLPLEGFAAKWEFGVYFQINIARGAEKEVRRVKAGDIGYWPPSQAICLFFADATPPAQMVKIGNITDDPKILSNAKSGSRIRIVRA